VELVEHTFEELGNLRYRMFTCPLAGEQYATALVIRFSGVFGIGSAGNGNAALMRVVTRAGLDAWGCRAVVFDLRELAYEWGNGIWEAFSRAVEAGRGKRLPCALVVSELCRNGFSSCAGMVPPMFDDLEAAVAFVARPVAPQ
jgi:hypothetical protein